MDLTLSAMVLLGMAALFTGASKSGVPGLAIFAVVLVPMVIPAKLSTGYIMPFLFFADILAVCYWRKSAVWRNITSILPAMLSGLFIGYLLMDRIDDASYGKVLGSLVIAILILDWARKRFDLPIPVSSRWFVWTLGFIAGVLAMLANAAGPPMMIYLLAMNMTKEEFVATNAWLFLTVNSIKIPFGVSLGLITLGSFKTNVMLFPFVIIGAILGVFVMRRIPGKTFNLLMRCLSFAGGIKLLF